MSADDLNPGRPLRVGVVTARAFPQLGGIESHVEEVATRLVERGHTVEVLTTDLTGTEPRVSARNGMTIRRYAAWPRRRDYYASPGLFWAVFRRSYDVLHIQGIHTLVPPMAMLAAIVRRRPFIVTFHTGGSSSQFRGRMRQRQFRLLAPLLRRAAGLVAVSEFEARLFEDVLGREPGSIQVIRNGGFTPASDPTRATVPDQILSVGRLERYKGHHRTIEALAEIIKQRPQARLRILGRGPYERELHALAETCGVADRVSIDFIAPEEREAMIRALGEAAVVSLLSDYESHPVAVIEALALGRPVVVLDNSGLTELIAEGWVTGLPSDASTSQIAETLIDQLAQPRTVQADMLPTWAGCIRQLNDLYATVADHPIR